MSADGIASTGPRISLVSVTAIQQTAFTTEQIGKPARIDPFYLLTHALLTNKQRQHVEEFIRRWNTWITRNFWLSQCLVFVLPFCDSSDSTEARAWLHVLLSVAIVVSALPCLLVSSLTLNVDMVRLVVQEPEFRVATLLNGINWCAVALAFQDSRLVVCVMEWWVIELAFLVDANAQHYHGHMRDSIISLILLVTYLVLAMTSTLSTSNAELLAVHGRPLSIVDILLWTVPTLALLLLKSLYHQIVRRATREPVKCSGEATASPASMTVYCSIHRARVSLRKLAIFESQAQPQERRVDSSSSPLPGVPVHCSNTLVGFIDITSTLMPNAYDPETHGRMRWLPFIVLYTTGSISIITLCYASVAAEIQTDSDVEAADRTRTPYTAFIGTILFTCAIARYYQRQLLLALLQTFEVIFCSLQFTTGSLLLAVFYQWDWRCLNILTWMIWYHWLLFLDALSPSVRGYLRFSNLAALPVLGLVCYAEAGIWSLFAIYSDAKLTSQTLRVANLLCETPHLHVEILLGARILTLWLWNARLFSKFGLGDDQELVFLRDLVEYTVSGGPTSSAGAPHSTLGPRPSAVSPQPSRHGAARLGEVEELQATPASQAPSTEAT